MRCCRDHHTVVVAWRPGMLPKSVGGTCVFKVQCFVGAQGGIQPISKRHDRDGTVFIHCFRLRDLGKRMNCSIEQLLGPLTCQFGMFEQLQMKLVRKGKQVCTESPSRPVVALAFLARMACFHRVNVIGWRNIWGQRSKCSVSSITWSQWPGSR